MHHAFLYNILAVVAGLRHETSNFTRTLYGVDEHNTKFSSSFSNLDTILSDSTTENFANIWQIKWNWIRSVNFETVWIHFLSDVFGLLSSRNFTTMATWRNDFSLLKTRSSFVNRLKIPWHSLFDVRHRIQRCDGLWHTTDVPFASFY